MDGNAAEHLHDFLRTLPTESVSQTHDVTSDSHQQLSDKPGMVQAVAQFEKAVLVLKLRAARTRIRKRKGVCEGAKPFGSYSGEAVVVDRIRALRRKPTKARRLSFARIASTLNAEGFRNRAGRPWSARMVFHVAKELNHHH